VVGRTVKSSHGGCEREGSFGKTKIVSGYDIRGTGGEARTKKGCHKWSFGWTGEGEHPRKKGRSRWKLMMHDGARLADD
jgi:hypothetical protein